MHPFCLLGRLKKLNADVRLLGFNSMLRLREFCPIPVNIKPLSQLQMVCGPVKM